MSRKLDRALASPDSKSRYVRRLFATIADRYDLITVLLSCGRDRQWKKRVVELAHVSEGTSVLDLACGTGDLAFAAAAAGGRVVALDVTARMIEIAKSKAAVDPVIGARTTGRSMGPARDRYAPAFVVADMMELPFPSASFDVVTTGYGLRNVPLVEAAIAEIARVLKPGGAFVSLDFNRPESAVVRAIYSTYLGSVGAALGWVLHRDPDTYRYIPA